MKIWRHISDLGVHVDHKDKASIKRIRFFNQVLFIGFFATLVQILVVWQFIGVQSLLFLVICAIIPYSLYLNSKQKFAASKWIYLLTVYSMGLLTTLLLGGSALYHLQVILIFLSCLIVFDLNRELLKIAIGIPFVIVIILLGELPQFNLPDFGDHPLFDIVRIANISSLFAVSALLVLFIIRLNERNERALNIALNELMSSQLELERDAELLEAKVNERTSELRKKNAEKEVLLQEVHHRVRNNMQIISSLLNLQINKVDEEEQKEVLRELKSRVDAMSVVHQRMYQTGNFDFIRVDQYIQQILFNFQEIHRDVDFQVKLDLDSEARLDLENAIPFGLILNEILSNFYKHVAQENDSAEFSIQLQRHIDTFQLIYRDNGPGFKNSHEIEDPETLGMQLIYSLAQQIEADIQCTNLDGAQIHIQIRQES